MAAILKDIKAAFGDVEAAPYTVVVQRGGYEERVYPARQWACTRMSGPSHHDLLSPMFRRLFCYISGRNEPNIRIDMTTPVTTLVQPPLTPATQQNINKQHNEEHKNGEDLTPSPSSSNGSTTSFSSSPSSSSTSSSSSSLPTYTMGFLVPASHQHHPPPSSDKNIFIEDRPEMVVLVRRFSGYSNDAIVQRELTSLHKAIRNNGDEAGVDFTQYYVAGYDPPFKLLGRRNEVWVVKKVEMHNGNNSSGNEGRGYSVFETNGAAANVKEEQHEKVQEEDEDLLGSDMVIVNENGNEELITS